MKRGGEDTAALAERYLDFWERRMATAMAAPAAPWSFEAWLAMVNAARLRAEREVPANVGSDAPDGTES
jgi:hypothetical protein